MNMMSQEQAREFASEWLPAWTGNDPEKLLNFYSKDALYLDPTIPDGVRGKEALRSYFKKLLSDNPEWVWTQIEGIPMEGGFLNKWRAVMPVGPKNVECVGVCFVQFDSDGKIRRNEVYFDTHELISEILKYNKEKKQ
ncbi:MAG: nuclear transport factor 2 family protein [Deltaproteobacteria bacterium]|nr:nuclear transport factor 2 family protein [Deltaproteobacteria bacterium]